ncbi:CPBP family intramembrane glutamic endopeptidase [Halegenticoccus tardaugens]|uniref:CPBP family intramembrane glutamic endopeptidase n=1 Tax=Halegenticoccus tardaugens TaxID=2071624 RepID=UPI00100C193E|nr:CPBP family intramembrane glutamic endopeptidase [Halegenticoccus tardaugens]
MCPSQSSTEIAWIGRYVDIDPADWEYRFSLDSVGAGLVGLVVYLVLYGAAIAVYASFLGLEPSIEPTSLGIDEAPVWAAALQKYRRKPTTVVVWRMSILVVNGVVVPITEELAWRGVIQTALTDTYGTTIAIVVTATAFVLKHLFVDLSAPLFSGFGLRSRLLAVLCVCDPLYSYYLNH